MFVQGSTGRHGRHTPQPCPPPRPVQLWPCCAAQRGQAVRARPLPRPQSRWSRGWRLQRPSSSRPCPPTWTTSPRRPDAASRPGRHTEALQAALHRRRAPLAHRGGRAGSSRGAWTPASSQDRLRRTISRRSRVLHHPLLRRRGCTSASSSLPGAHSAPACTACNSDGHCIQTLHFNRSRRAPLITKASPTAAGSFQTRQSIEVTQYFVSPSAPADRPD